MKVKIVMDGYRCLRCSHEWVPTREATPRICPRCKTAYWDVPRKVKANADVEVA